MNISKGFRWKIDMGGYESEEISVQPTLSHYDLGYTDEEWAGLTDDQRFDETERLLVQHAKLAARLATPELERCARLTDKRDSVVHQLIQESMFDIPTEEPNRRSVRRARG